MSTGRHGPVTSDAGSDDFNKQERTAAVRPDEPWYKQHLSTPVFNTALLVIGSLLVALYTGVFPDASERRDNELAAVAVGLEARLLEGIKARILEPVRPPARQPPQAGVPSVVRRILPLERAAGSALFKELERGPPIDIVIAPKVCTCEGRGLG